MRAIRNFFAVMLTVLAFAAFQVDADAQSREGVSRSTKTTRSAGSSSHVNRSSSSNTQKKQSAVKPSAQTRPSSQARPSTQTKPSVQTNRPSSTRPSVQSRPSNGRNQSVSKPDATRPSVQTRPSTQTKPSTGTPEKRPQSGAVNDRKPSSSVTRPNRPENRPAAGSTRPEARPKAPVKVYPDRKPEKPRVHPTHRDFIAYDRPSHFWTSHNHFFGHRVRFLPAKARTYRHYGVTYYCYNDIWYRPFGGYYVVCRPPFGTVLAANIIADMAWAAVRFAYYNTVANTYRQINENNEHIAEQNAVIAQNNAIIAQQNKTIEMNQEVAAATVTLADELGLIQSYAAAGTEYFYQDGVFYVMDANGEYKVIVPPAGALVESLPEDYEMITLVGNEYYKVDDTVYKITLSDGKPYFEVLGQIA